MSTSLPCRALRIPVRQRQCVFQRCQPLPNRSPVTAFTSRAFSSTPTQCREGSNIGQDKSMTRAAARQQASPSPLVNLQQAQRDMGAMAEDIGLLQDTLIRAPFSKLPAVWSPAFYGYFWKLIKSKATGLYSRIVYNRMLETSRGRSWIVRATPVDVFNNDQLKTFAKKYYEQVYGGFVKNDMAVIRRFCLPPLARDFENRLSTRRNLDMTWKFDAKSCSARVVSHRASVLGEDTPDTAYRQAVVRLRSKQSLTLKQHSSSREMSDFVKSTRQLAWRPSQVQRQTEKEEQELPSFADNGATKTVVEYIVLQKRLINGKEQESWMVQGFAEESTPQKIMEDEEYWTSSINAQAKAQV